jgi:hypothetical protein
VQCKRSYAEAYLQERNVNMEEGTQWKNKVLVIGGVIGGLVGVGTAHLLVQRAEREGQELKLGTGEGIRLGLMVLGMLRQVSRLGDGGE